jgi:hypothetical protein
MRIQDLLRIHSLQKKKKNNKSKKEKKRRYAHKQSLSFQS